MKLQLCVCQLRSLSTAYKNIKIPNWKPTWNKPKKAKSCPTTRHGGACGDRKHSSYSFPTLDGEGASIMPWPRFSPGKRTPVPTVREPGWVPEPVWTQRLEEKSSRLCRGSNLDRQVVHPVARYYTEWAIRLTETNLFVLNIGRMATDEIIIRYLPCYPSLTPKRPVTAKANSLPTWLTASQLTTPWSRVFKLTVLSVVKLEPKSSVPCSQQPAILSQVSPINSL
jgi:hypothetical protein